SSDVIKRYDPLDLVRFGVSNVWIGIESKFKPFSKNMNIDLAGLMKGLHDAGIKTFGSMIFGFDSQTRDMITEDMDYFMSLSPTFAQFAALLGFPGTEDYLRFNKEGRFIKDLTQAHFNQSGNIRYKHVGREEMEGIVDTAYSRFYEETGPSMLKAFEINLNRYRTVMEHGIKKYIGKAKNPFKAMEPLYLLCEEFAPNERVRKQARLFIEDYEREFQPISDHSRAFYEKGIRSKAVAYKNGPSRLYPYEGFERFAYSRTSPAPSLVAQGNLSI
ncbi:MAG: hypothetical protein ABH825_02300, partial [Candidatus Omnitrophota bacterium]